MANKMLHKVTPIMQHKRYLPAVDMAITANLSSRQSVATRDLYKGESGKVKGFVFRFLTQGSE